MNVIDNVFTLADKIYKTGPFHIKIDFKELDYLINDMKLVDPVSNNRSIKYPFLNVIKILVSSSINYCYWYGSHKIKPVSSTMLVKIIDDCFNDARNHAFNFRRRIDRLIELLSLNKFPLLEQREKHLIDLCRDRKAEAFAYDVVKREKPGEDLFEDLVRLFPGFASDVFLKRASLFFILLNREFGWYDSERDLMQRLFVPADYQLPKILRYYKCLNYSDELSYKVDNSILINKDSLEELQIRAATIKACEYIRIKTKWSIAHVDEYLWSRRDSINDPFHLTITSNY